MSNGDVIGEVRRMIDSHEKINEDVFKRMMLVLLTDIYTKIDNPLVRLGVYIQKHPKTAAFGVCIFLLSLNLWFVTGLRAGVMEWLGMPQSLIDFLSGTVVP